MLEELRRRGHEVALRPGRLRAKVHEAVALRPGAERIAHAFAAAGGATAAADAFERELDRFPGL